MKVYFKTVFSTNVSASSLCKTECLALELQVNGNVTLICAMYNPPDNEVSTFLQCELATLLSSYDHCLLIGDLNTDWLRSSRRKECLDELFTTYSMTVLGTEPTHFYDGGCSQLDLLVTNRPDVVTTFHQVSVPGLSKHDLIFCSLNIDICPTTPISEGSYYDYVNFDSAALRDCINDVSWDVFYDIDNVDQLTEFFDNSILAVHDSCIPKRTIKRRRHHNTWFNDDIRKAILERDLAYKDWRIASTDNKTEKKRVYLYAAEK